MNATDVRFLNASIRKAVRFYVFLGCLWMTFVAVAVGAAVIVMEPAGDPPWLQRLKTEQVIGDARSVADHIEQRQSAASAELDAIANELNQ